MTETKPTNPKDLIGSGKLPLHLWPETATALGSLGLLDGMLKYGRSNWRVAGVRASIYIDALKRHANAYFEGEDNDPDSGLPHLAHALACIAILVDAKAAGKLTDDRMVAGGYRAHVDALTPHVDRLKAKHAGKTPKHYTIADNAASGTYRCPRFGCGLETPHAHPDAEPIRVIPRCNNRQCTRAHDARGRHLPDAVPDYGCDCPTCRRWAHGTIPHPVLGPTYGGAGAAHAQRHGGSPK